MKNTNNKKIKDHLWVYWIVWGVITLLMLYVKYIFYKEQRDSFGLGIIYMFSMLMPIGILSMHEYNKLVVYIEEKYPEESKNYTGAFEKRARNEFLAFANKKSLNDLVLRRLIKNYRKFNGFLIVVVVTLIVFSISTIYL